MLTYGFYNSVNKDRKYDAEQIGAIFNGIITDGVFANYKNALKVTAGTGRRELVISSGRAWFNGTWTDVDDSGHSIYLMGSAVETTYFVYLAVDKIGRRNSIAWYSSIRDNEPEKSLYFYLLAQVTIPGGVDTIEQSMITDTRGSDTCPYVTGILETVSFEEVVREVCSENWQMWLDAYSTGLNDGLVAATTKADEALKTANEAKTYVFDNEDPEYTWAKYTAVETGVGSYEWGIDKSVSESDTAPPSRILYRTISITGSSAVLSNPPVTHRDTPLTATEQLSKWRKYQFFYGDGTNGQTDGTVYRYDALSMKTTGVGVGGSTIAHDVYSYTVSKFIPVEAAKEPGEYLGTVTANTASAYPRNGYKDGYWYIRFAAPASEVFFDDEGLSISARTVQEAIAALTKLIGSGSTGGSTPIHVEVDSLPVTGAYGITYVVKNPEGGDSDEYIWVDRWEKLGGSSISVGSGINDTARELIIELFSNVSAYNTDQSANIAALNVALGGNPGESEPEEPDGPVDPEQPGEPVYTLAAPYTTTGDSVLDTDVVLADVDKDWTVCCDLTGKPGYQVPAWGFGTYIGVWSTAAYKWFAGYNTTNWSAPATSEIATGSLSNARIVVTHAKGEATITVHYVSAGTAASLTASGLDYSNIVGSTATVTLGGAPKTDDNAYWAANNTINEFEVYERMLTEEEIVVWLGVNG